MVTRFLTWIIIIRICTEREREREGGREGGREGDFESRNVPQILSIIQNSLRGIALQQANH